MNAWMRQHPNPPRPHCACRACVQVWPQLGLLHASVAKLAHLLERPAEALPAAQEAARILSATHGGGSAAEEARRVAAEAEAELAVGAARRLGSREDIDD